MLALILAATGAGVHLLLARSLQARTEEDLRADAAAFRALVAHEAEEEPGWAAVEVVRGAIREAGPLLWRVAVYDAGGTLVGSSAGPADGLSAGSRRAQTVPGPSAPQGGGGTESAGVRVVSLPLEVRGTRFTGVVSRATADEAEVLAQLRISYAALFPLTLALAGLVGYLLARRALAPLSEMGRRAERIGAGTLGARLPTGRRQDEVSTLARVFNDLLARLDDAFSRQRRFMTDASHELRTPVAIIRGEAEVVLARPERGQGEYREALEVVLGEAERLTRIVDDLFTLSRADAGQHSVVEEELYLDDLLAECCRSFRAIAAARGVALLCEASAESPMRGDPALLRRLVLNLLDNATRHTPAGGVVRLTLDAAHGDYRVRVVDTGTGIPDEAAPHVFERFFRADSARVRASEHDGAGLGLPIARWIAEVHGGRLELLHTGAEGTTFQFFLPRGA